jgi:hypothetical protein
MPGKKTADTKEKTGFEGIDTSLNYRSMSLCLRAEDGTPASLDEATRSVEMIGATESPVLEIDWDRWELVPTVLRMDGCQMPKNGQLPLLDTHTRYNTSCLIGSYRNMRISGTDMLGRAHFSAAPEAEGPYLKTKEGHLTDCSVARKDVASTYIPEGQKQTVGGIEYEGPLRVVTKWIPKEMSMCPIGADDLAKVRAATPTVIPQTKKEEEMDPKVRAFLVTRGLSETATEAEAYAFMETLNVRTEAVVPAAPNLEVVTEQVRQTIIAEQTRCSDIRSICSRAGFDEAKISSYITAGTSVDAVRSAAFEQLVTNGPTAGGTGFRGSLEMGADSRDKFRSAAEGAILLRSGRTVGDDLVKLGARDLAGFTLMELARESLRMAGQPIYGNALEMIGRAFTTSDFPLLLANVANKALLEGWETQEETWQTWVAEGSVSDFKTHTAVRPGEVDSLDEIGEDDEYKYGSRAEQAESYKIATFGKLFKLSRQTIINDDLGALTDLPKEHGEAATRTVGDVVYAVLTANGNMGDGKALFHADHKNLLTGAALDVTSLGAIEVAMGLQKDIGGKRRLNIKPVFFLAPLTLKPASEQFFATPVIGTQASPNVQNIYSGAYFTRVYEPRLDDASVKAWYLAARKGKTVKVFFLNGNKTPFLDTKQGWNVDGVEFKVRIDCGAKAMSWKGIAKNPGP